MKIINPLSWSGKQKIVSGILTISLITGFVWRQTHQPASNQAPTQTATVERGDLITTLTLSGTVEQSNLISVFTKASGVVSQVYVTDGQTVAQGDKLAEITLDSQGQTNQAQAWASYLSSKKNAESSIATQYSQQATMFDSWDDYINKTNDSQFEDPNSTERELAEFQIIQKQWLAAEINYKSQAIAIQGAQASKQQAWYNYTLYQSTITAPVTGTIVGLNLAEGLTVSGSTNTSGGAVNQTVATIKTGGLPIASFQVTEIDINQIQVGQKATLILDSLPNTSFTGTIASVDRVGSVTNGVTQYGVLVKFDSTTDQILPNMAITAKVILDREQSVLKLPVTAVTTQNDQSFVQVLRDGQQVMLPVETGLSSDTEIEIVSGLSEGDTVIITGLQGITGQSTQNSGFSGFGGGGGTFIRMGGPGGHQ